MIDTQILEAKYLDAKIAYYTGFPIMSDPEFDALEQVLKKANSPVIRQVGMKKSDFDFPHPTPMLSLDKIQTEETPDGIDYKVAEVFAWAEDKCKKIGIAVDTVKFEYSPKYDGNAINVIYINGNLHKILSRSDKNFGKDLTEKLKHIFPATINEKNGTLEMRYEIVLSKELYNKKYSDKANPRNTVAGILGTDDITDSLKDLTVKQVCVIHNGEYKPTRNRDFYVTDIYQYKSLLDFWITNRDSFEYQLDGMVITFPVEFRKKLGANDHDPNWSLAIKFVPEEATTTIIDIEWGVGKTGELTPVGILDPVQLAGTKVSRVSLYNIGNVINKGLAPGALISIQKAGDIIPEVKTVIVPASIPASIPTYCPSCGSILKRDAIHLTCMNITCKAKLVRLLANHMKVLKLKGAGQASIDLFAEAGFTIVDLICFVRENGNNKTKMEQFGFTYGSRSCEIFVNIFKNIKSIDFSILPIFLGINNVGKKLSIQVAKYYYGMTPDWSNQDSALVTIFEETKTKFAILTMVERLKKSGIEIIYPEIKATNNNAIKAELTGSPKNFGWNTKEEFMTEMEIEEASLSDSDCQFLITDDYHSKTSKMKNAAARGITIISYIDFAKKIKKL